MKHLISAIFSICTITILFAQPSNPPANLDQDAFKSWLKQNWFDGEENIVSGSTGYKNARLEMYNDIDNVNGSVYCIYSDFEKSVPSSLSTPGDLLPINCEHIVPQSIFGSTGKMRNDIHHLATCYDNWNSSRGNLPFNENIDELTTKWMRLDNDISCSSNCAPTSLINEYSEQINGVAFEPKEDVKGNVARSVLYFFTMYPTYNISDVADVEVLYNWHLNDLPDASEIDRNDDVENYQGNRNPYIDFPEWVAMAWIDSTVISVPAVTNNNPKFYISSEFLADGFLNFTIKNLTSSELNYSVFNINGKLLIKTSLYAFNNYENISIDISSFSNGNYILQVSDNQEFIKTKKFRIAQN